MQNCCTARSTDLSQITWRVSGQVTGSTVWLLMPCSSHHNIYITIYSTNITGDPKNWNLFIKNCVFILTCLNFSHLQSALHLMQYTYPDVFSTAQNRFWTRQFWCLFEASSCFCCFLLHLFHISKMFPFEDFFLSEETKKYCTGWDQVNREGGAWGSCCFWPKPAEHSTWYEQVRS